jgi:hypothetical protein
MCHTRTSVFQHTGVLDRSSPNVLACFVACVGFLELDWPMGKRTVIVNDKMQKGYRYQITEPAGRNFDPEFRPQLKPKKMLALGVFCG